MSRSESAIQWAVSIAADDIHGYDQKKRWGPNYDCSSLLISAWQQAGVPVLTNGATYTGNMRPVFVKCGFQSIKFVKGMSLQRGDVLLSEKHHTAMYIGDNKVVMASINEQGKITGGRSGDQTGREILVCSYYVPSYGWDYVLRYNESEVQFVDVQLPVLQIGSRCKEVGTLQTLLKALGFKNKAGRDLTIDSDFGQNTDYAVKLFQRTVDLTPDGIVGAKTWDRLLKSTY